MPEKDIRDHGFGKSPEVTGVPTVVEPVKNTTCPNCQCTSLYLVQVPVKGPSMLRVPQGRKAYSTYVGCPACPWASPAMLTAR